MTEKQPNPAALVPLYKALRGMLDMSPRPACAACGDVICAHCECDKRNAAHEALALADSPPSVQQAVDLAFATDEGIKVRDSEITALRRELDKARGIIERAREFADNADIGEGGPR